MKNIIFFAALAALSPLPAYCQEAPAFSKAEIAAASSDPLRYTIDPRSVTVELLSRPAPAAPTARERGAAGNIVTIINIANKIWGVIKDNAPVAEVESKYAAAVPQGAASPNQLYEWKGPQTYEYRFSARNLYGAEAVSVSYKVVFSYGGKFDGKGAYLTGVTIVPGAINVLWGYKLSMSAFVPDTTITNLGTYEDPLAAMQIKLSSKISTVLKEWNGNSVYLIRGDGEMKTLVSPFKPEKNAGELAAGKALLDPAAAFGR
ncbi:MAG TPA: hypothetical protein DCS63_10840 [Elusimicrobia bacterium]|nr:hypothetical protein [Elusimicrobiota bacterium]